MPSDDPRRGNGGGSPDRAPARAAEADRNTADVAPEASDPRETRDPNIGELSQNEPRQNAEYETLTQPIPTAHRDTEMDRIHPTSPETQTDLTHRPSQITQKPRRAPMKGALKIATLNIKGAGSSATEHKWGEISDLMTKEKIDILTVQETHLTEENRKRLNETYEKRLHFIATLDESTPNKMGVAVILNKRTTKWKQTSTKVIIHGRAIVVDIPWSTETTITCLALYAPNQPNQNKEFWERLEDHWKKEKWGKPTCMMGDFNVVEDSADRLPPHNDSTGTINSLMSLKNQLNQIDGWRRENPTEIDFTFRTENGHTQSRIDRIYIREDLLEYTHKWKIERTGIQTDHLLTHMSLVNPWTPYQGPGRYAMPTFLLEHRPLRAKMQEHIKDFYEKIKTANLERTQEINPQTVHREMKEKLIQMVRQYAKCITSKMDKNIADLEEDKKKVLNNHEWDNEGKSRESAMLDERIRELKRIKMLRARDNTEAKFFLEGEVLRKPWINANKDTAPRDMIAALRDENKPDKPLTRRSKVMADLVKRYHDDLQNKDPIGNQKEHRKEVKKVLSHVRRKLKKEHAELLATNITKEEIREAINNLPNGKAAGPDGIPQEIWKNLLRNKDVQDEKGGRAPDEESEHPDIADYLTILYNDIENHGAAPETGFADGWMCPIYKKGDRTDAGNYRPITVLNTDYKTFTKALTNRLSEVTPNIIHHDQAGFMKGRRIEDQTELANLIVAWGEKKEKNGMIVCLDQEKAYDRVRHTFVWGTLKRFGFPKSFIKTIKTLYLNAETTVIVNGEKSPPYKVNRGVRQGDPMSCLIFNMVIESLAQMLRDSKLEGIRVERETQRLVAKLFADDTTVYMSENDNLEDLHEILRTWCKASGGRFNTPKSAIIPVGTKTFRTNLIETRTTNGTNNKIPDEIKITGEGNSTRLLGSFIGNNIDNPSIWAPTLELIAKDLARWNRGHPTIDGRRLIIGMVVGGRTQYRTSVQGMPTEIEQRLTKMIREFIWGDTTHPPIGLETLYKPIEQGGKKLLSIKTRNEAIDLMRAQRYLNLSETRPTWAKIADSLIQMNLLRKWNINEEEAYQNVFLQTLTANTRETEEGLPRSLRTMLKAAGKYNLGIPPTRLETKPKLDLPIWYHVGLADEKNPGYNTPTAKCQRNNHKIKTVRDLITLIRDTNSTLNEDHRPRKNCKCRKCRTMRANGCKNPHKCGVNARKMLKKLGNEWNPFDLSDTGNQINEGIKSKLRNETSTLFNKDMQIGRSLSETFRVFIDKERKDQDREEINRQAIQYNRERRIGPPQWIQAYTDGSCQNNGYEDAKAGAGVWYGENDPRNIAAKVPDHLTQSNNAGEALAILLAAKNTDKNDHLEILTDSKITIECLTKSLVKNENAGWIGIENKEILQAAASHLRNRIGQTILTKVKGHSGLKGNDEADRLAKLGTQLNQKPETNAEPVEGHYTLGARLCAASQALLYKGIIERKTPANRRGTTINLDKARWALKEMNGDLPTDKNIWKSLKDRTITRETRAFLWKAMHNAYKVGEYWEKIPNYETRSWCHICDTTEDMEHILTSCKATGQETVWNLTKQLCEQRGLEWTNPSLGIILGCNLADPKHANGETTEAGKRIYRITVSESARLIWKIRCDWRISKEADPERILTAEEITKKWRNTLLKRIKLDCLTSNIARYGKRAVDEALVANTWDGIIQENQKPHRIWKSALRVLVGMGVDRPPGRNR